MAVDYSVGGLAIDLKLNGYDTAMAQIERLKKQLNKQDISPVKKVTVNNTQIFTEDLMRLKNINLRPLYATFSSLTRIITPFVDKLKEGSAELKHFASIQKSVASIMNTGYKQDNLTFRQETQAAKIAQKATASGLTSSKLSSSLSNWFNIGKIHYLINMSKQYVRIMMNMFQSAVDYNETLNLWQVAMRGNIDVAEQFISKMSRSYGLAEETLMRYQATFKNMLASLGDLEDGVSTKLSEVILARAVDFASLYNVTNERAMTVFQAVLSGQVRPIRSISGYDITENTIFDIYKKAGGDKTVRQLSQIEKRLLRIYAIFGQMDTSGATGDWAKQIEEPANQLRILGEQFKELGQWIGQLFLNVFAPMLPKLNAFVMTIKEITKALAQMAGYTKPNHLEDFTESINETDEAIESLTGKLFSFDKFDVAGGGSSSNIFGIDPTVQGLLDSMNTSIKDITMEATKLSEQWLHSLGFIKEIDEKTGKWTGGWKFGGNLNEIIGKITEVATGLAVVFGLFVAIKHPILSLVGLITGLYATDEKLRAVLNDTFKLIQEIIVTLLPPLVQIAKDILPVIIDIVRLLLPLVRYFLIGLSAIVNWIVNDMGNDLARAGQWFIDIFNNVTSAIGNFFSNLWKGIANDFASIINWISNGFIALVNLAIDVINAILKPVDMIAGLFGGKVQIGHWNAQVNWQPYPTYADGGFPAQGQMFIARESGAEMVGNIGGRTAVANNDQIVAGVAGGVREAVQPLVIIGQAIYRTMQSGGNMQINIDGQKLANNLTPRIKGNLAREGVVL